MSQTNEYLKALVDLRDRQIQKARIQFTNRLSAIDRGADDANDRQRTAVLRWGERFDLLEKQLNEEIADEVKHYVIYPHLIEIRGIGPMMAAKLISMIDIERADTVSALWRYAGLAVVNGEREKLVKGEKAHYNSKLKTTCYLIAQSFIKSGSPYRSIYDTAKEFYTVNRPEWTKMRCHLAALRKMEKIFLQHLWLTWRQLEGLETRQLYVVEKLGHTHIMEPKEFGWNGATAEKKPRKRRNAQTSSQR